MQVNELQRSSLIKNKDLGIKLNSVKISSFLIAILPILSIYKPISGIPNFGVLALILITLLSFVNVKTHLKIPKICFFWYFVGSFLISIMSIVIRNQSGFGGFLSQYIRIFFFYYIIDIACENKMFDYVFMQRCNVLAGVLVSIILIFQVIVAKLIGRAVFFFLPFFPVDYNLNSAEIVSLFSRFLGTLNWRPISIFCEPAHYAQFVLLSLAISLFCKENVLTKKQKIWISLFLSISILLSYSANGMFVMLFIWGMWLLHRIRTKKKENIIILVLVIFVGIYLLETTDFLDKALERMSTVSLDSRSTGTLRLLQGIEVFKTLNWVEKLFGIGFGNIQGYLIDNNITTKYLSEIGNSYMNGFSTVLVSGGIIGLVIYCSLWVRMFFKHKSAVGRAAFIAITILFCTSALFFSCTTVMYLVLIQCSEKYDCSN